MQWKRDKGDSGCCCGTCDNKPQIQIIDSKADGVAKTGAKVVAKLHPILELCEWRSEMISSLAKGPGNLIYLKIDLAPLLLWDSTQWRRMYLTQPPCERIQVRYQAQGTRFGYSTRIIDVHTTGGVTFGNLISQVKCEVRKLERARRASETAQIAHVLTLIIPEFVTEQSAGLEQLEQNGTADTDDHKSVALEDAKGATGSGTYMMLGRLVAKRQLGATDADATRLILEDFGAFD